MTPLDDRDNSLSPLDGRDSLLSVFLLSSAHFWQEYSFKKHYVDVYMQAATSVLYYLFFTAMRVDRSFPFP